ncbi:hypothetical protein HYU07_03210 [Candidatus Woesearchaeota archaeon]|nr:hypothetical protein [Candidatus Woesearchaeota archaeon]
MVTKKDRRHSGYVTPHITISPKDLIRYNLFIDDYYDEWVDYRDGFRDWFRDFKKIKNIKPRVRFFNENSYKKRICMNLKQKRLLRRRKVRKSERFINIFSLL